MYSRLKGLRVMLGKKQDDFAELLGITKQAYSAKERGKTSFKDTEKIILADGWIFQAQVGSHRHYIHPSKSGKVTIPFHCKDIPKGTENSILKQAGLK